jgi:hypothetical protein
MQSMHQLSMFSDGSSILTARSTAPVIPPLPQRILLELTEILTKAGQTPVPVK